MAEDASVKAKPVVRLLQQFSHGIVSTTREANRRDSVKKSQARSKKEERKWQNRYDLFAPLADLQRRNLASNEKKTAKSDVRLNEIRQDHREITGQLATTLGLGDVGVEKTITNHSPSNPRAVEVIESNQLKMEQRLKAMDEEHAKLERLSNSRAFEVIESKQLKMEQRLQSIDEEHAKLERLGRRIAKVENSTVPSSSIRAMEKNAADLAVNADKVEKAAKRYANLEARFETLEHGMKANETSINRTRDEITAHTKDIQMLQGSDKDHITRISDLKRIVDQESEGLRVLREVVSGGEDGDNKERSLFDMIIDAQKDNSKFREAIGGLDQTMNDFEDGMKELKSQATKSDAAAGNLEIRLTTLEDERSGNDIQGELRSMREQLSVLSEEVKKVVNEQHVKDDMVATEVERLDNELMRQANNVKVLSEKLETAASKDSNQPPSNPTPEMPNTSPQLANGILKEDSREEPNPVHQLELKQESIKQDIDGLQSSFERFKNMTTDTTSTHDLCINSLQQRFDNLTTDHMVRAMINQLQSLYPNHPGNLSNQVNQLAVNQRHFFDSMSQVSRQLTDLEKIVQSNQEHVVPLIRQGCEKVEMLFQNRLDAQNAGRTQLRESIKSDMDQRLQALNNDCQENSSVIKQDLDAHLNRIQNLQKSLQTSRNEHTSALNALKKDLQDLQTTLQPRQPPGPLPEIHSLETQLTDMRDSTVRELTLHYDAIRVLNAQCGLSNAALMGEADDDNSLRIRNPHDEEESTKRRARSTSISLGQPSSPTTPRASTSGPAAQLTMTTDGAASDSDPPVSITHNRKRRGRPRKDESARARKVSKTGE